MPIPTLFKSRHARLAGEILLFVAAICVAVPVGKYSAKLYDTMRSHIKSGDYAEHVRELPHAVTLYGTATCPACKKTREYLRQAGIAFNDLDIDASNDALQKFNALGQASVPVVVVDGALVVGYYPDDFKKLIEFARAPVAGQQGQLK